MMISFADNIMSGFAMANIVAAALFLMLVSKDIFTRYAVIKRLTTATVDYWELKK